MGEKYGGRKFETVFISRELPDDTRTAEIMELGVKFHKMGLLPAEEGGHAGNMSFRNHKGFVITAGGVNKGRLTPRNFVQVLSCNMDLKKVEAEGELEPSSETFIHYLIYRERADVNAIIHVHDKLVMQHFEKLKIKSTKAEHPYGTVELAYEVEKALGHQRVIVVKGHGIISLGKSPWEAGNMIMAAHQSAENAEKE